MVDGSDTSQLHYFSQVACEERKGSLPILFGLEGLDVEVEVEVEVEVVGADIVTVKLSSRDPIGYKIMPKITNINAAEKNRTLRWESLSPNGIYTE